MSDSPREQIAVNLVFTVIKSVSVLISLRLADTLIAAQTMGLLLLMRRQGALWGALTQLGFSQSIQKFYPANANAPERRAHWATMMRWVLLVSALFCALCVIFGGWFADTMLGADDPRLGWIFGVYVAGLALGYIASSSWQAEFRFLHSNLIDWLNGSLIFIGCLVLAYDRSDQQLLLSLGALTFTASLLSVAFFAHRFHAAGSLVASEFSLPAAVIGYSATRALTAFVDFATIVVGPWLLRDTPDQAGYLIIALVVIRVAQTLVMPVARVLALRANSYRHERVREERLVIWFAGLSFMASCLLMVGYWWVGEGLLRWWLPNSHGDVAPIVDRIVLFLPAIAVYYAIRNHVELRFVYPVNLTFLLLSMLTFFAVYFVQQESGLAAVTVALSAMYATYYVYSLLVAGALMRMRSKGHSE